MVENEAIEEETPDDENENQDKEKLAKRLENLSGFQLSIIKHAMSFPAAERITYSTCSLHSEENEQVVVQALLSGIARSRGWRVLKRTEQVEGMKKWHKRGEVEAVRVQSDGSLKEDEIADACIRCDKGGEDGTMGFFVAGFVRDEGLAVALSAANGKKAKKGSVRQPVVEEVEEDEAEENEWGGFSEDES